MRTRPMAAHVFLLLLTGYAMLTPHTQSYAGGGGPDTPGGDPPNVTWSLTDWISACPAGDSVIAGHPARLRILVIDRDGDGEPIAGVPPSSIHVTYAADSGNVRVNDQGAYVYADDSTNGEGRARLTIPSLSGQGNLKVTLYVSGANIGYKIVHVRTTDPDASGRDSLGNDQSSPGDIDWSNSSTHADSVASADHLDHWRRNALHGTLVQRTSYCDTCAYGAVGSRGASQIFWSPSGRFISHTSYVATSGDPGCKVFIVPSDPIDGNQLLQVTSVPTLDHDYDPSWSPLNDVLVFDRNDRYVIKRGLPWSGDTTETTISSGGNCEDEGDDVPAISPDGQWVAFSRCNVNLGFNVWKIRIDGTGAKQLTPAVGKTEFYTGWSIDGQYVYFQRQDANGAPWAIYKVPADSGAVSLVFSKDPAPPDTFDAVQPAPSPDGKVLLLGYGKRSKVTRNVITHTLDPALASPTLQKLIANYPDTTFAEKTDFPVLGPRLSPDGTRTALGAKQVWAARRNMNAPPVITSVSWINHPPATSIADTVVMYQLSRPVSVSESFQVSANDAEGDALDWHADILGTGTSFDTSTRTLTWSTSTTGTTYSRIRVSEPAGGSDFIIFKLTATSSLMGERSETEAARGAPGESGFLAGPSPTSAEFRIQVPSETRGTVWLRIYDVGGRECATVRGAAGNALVWRGTNRDGTPAAPGIYLYRVESRVRSWSGRIVLMR